MECEPLPVGCFGRSGEMALGRRGIQRVALGAALVVALGACSSSGSKGAEVTTTSVTDVNGTEVGSSPNVTQATSPPTAPPTTAVHETAPLRLTETGFTSYADSIGTAYTSAGAIVVNPRKVEAACGVHVTFNLKNAAGAVIDTSTTDVDWIPSGGRILVAPDQIGFEKPGATSMGVTTIVDGYATAAHPSDCPDSFVTSKGVQLQIVSAGIASDGIGGTTVQGQVRNQTANVVGAIDTTLTCVFRKGTVLSGGLQTSVDNPIPPGGTVAFDSGGDVPPGVTAVECQALI